MFQRYQHIQDQVRTSHYCMFMMNPGSMKMYHDMCQSYQWSGQKKDIHDTIFECIVYQQVKIENQKPGGLLQPLSPLEWNWDCIMCIFITHLLTSHCQKDVVWMIVNHLTKLAHFIPNQMTYSMLTLAKQYWDQIIRLHGVLREIVSNRDPRFTLSIWRSFLRELGAETKFSTTYHPQTDGQSERTIQILEDLLKSLCQILVDCRMSICCQQSSPKIIAIRLTYCMGGHVDCQPACQRVLSL